MLFSALLATVVAAHAVVAAPAAASSSASAFAALNQPIPPTEDPWYTAPYEFDHEAPGTVLRVRPAPGNLTMLAGSNCSAAYNILYRTTNSLYQASWAVTTLFVPKTPKAVLLSYQEPYDSVYLNAGPSYALYGGVGSDITAALGRGWFVSVPDYEGPLASFTAGVMAGHATLDGLRAVQARQQNGASRFGLLNDTRFALWGYSGGGLASEWAAELQAQYAPELAISGAALGGLTPNVVNVLQLITGQASAGLAPPALLGITNQYPAVYSKLESYLKPSGPNNRTGFLAATNMTLGEALTNFAFKNISDYFVDGFRDVLTPDNLQVVYRDGIMGYHGVPQFPLYVYKAIHDTASPVNDTDALVDKYCGVGANILYERTSIGGHTAGSINGDPSATAWLESVLGGTYAFQYNATGCTIRDVAWNISTLPF